MRLIFNILAPLVLLILGVTSKVQADNFINNPRIESVLINPDGRTLTITGEEFESRPFVKGRKGGVHANVFINGMSLNILLFSDQTIITELPKLAPGTYRVTVANHPSALIQARAFVAIGGMGTPGPAGPQGPAGATGATGPQGPSGPMGPDGPQGVTGLTGQDGQDGRDGADGAAGSQGPAGADGAHGPVGPTGPQGISGAMVGTVQASMLTPEQFAAAASDPAEFNSTTSKWVLADGRDVTNSRYAVITGNTNIPDMRGVFLRGLNAGRSDDFADPDGMSRTPGDQQMDQFQGHGHFHEQPSGDANFPAGTFQGTFGTDVLVSNRIYWPSTISDFGEARYGTETRGKNVAVYYYIKIND